MSNRSQQGTGINRAPIAPGTLTDAQCVDADALVSRMAVDAADYAHLVDVLGIKPFANGYTLKSDDDAG